MKTLKVMTRVRVDGWVEVSHEVPDGFDAANIDIARTEEDATCEDMAAEARLLALESFARVVEAKTLAVRFEVVP